MAQQNPNLQCPQGHVQTRDDVTVNDGWGAHRIHYCLTCRAVCERRPTLRQRSKQHLDVLGVFTASQYEAWSRWMSESDFSQVRRTSHNDQFDLYPRWLLDLWEEDRRVLPEFAMQFEYFDDEVQAEDEDTEEESPEDLEHQRVMQLLQERLAQLPVRKKQTVQKPPQHPVEPDWDMDDLLFDVLAEDGEV